MNASPALLLALAISAALSGCNKQEADPNATAGGEILPRSITDDMPPYDTVQSQPPLANPDAGLAASAGRRPAPQASAGAEEADEAVAEEPVPAEEE